jgi:hypothetical protein
MANIIGKGLSRLPDAVLSRLGAPGRTHFVIDDVDELAELEAEVAVIDEALEERARDGAGA